MKEEARKYGQELTDEDLDLIVSIAEQQAEAMRELKSAIDAGDPARIVEAARRVCGLENRLKAS